MATADVQHTGSGIIGDVGMRSGQRTRRDGGSTSRGPATTSRTVPCRQSGDLTSRLSSHQRRRSRGGGDRTSRTTNPVLQSRPQPQPQGTRRASESALLPPIRSGAGPRHPSQSSPTHDANVTSSPTSTAASSPLNTNAPVAVNAALLPATDSDVDTPRSPLNRKATTPLSKITGTADNPETTPRLSPVASSELIRQRAERRVLKSVNDAMNDISSVNKTAAGDGGVGASTINPSSQAASTKPQAPGSKGKLSRRISTQSLPKLATSEEPFSVRRKIEQFRKWHEEQYSDKLKKLRVESETDGHRDVSSSVAPNTSAAVQSADVLDFAKYLEQNINSDTPRSSRKPKKGQAERAKKDVAALDLSFTSESHQSASNQRQQRCKSGATWHTWRDVNDSYAYNNVNKYIEENELLPPDRVDWIESWLGEVEKALGLGEEIPEEEDIFTTLDLVS